MATIFDIPITKIAEDLGIKKSTQKNKYHCFNHDKEDKSPSLVIYDPGRFECMSCHITGSRYELVQYKLKLKDLKEARKWIFDKYKLTSSNGRKSDNKKLHIRFIQNQSKKEEHRFTFLPEEELFLREPNEEDINGIEEKLHKKYSLQTLLDSGVKIADGLGRAKWSGIVFTSNMPDKGILYNPNNCREILHLEGRTDWLTAIQMGLQQNFGVQSDYNKTSFYIHEQKLNVFILDQDTEESDIRDKVKKECSLKFIRLSEKDLSDLYYKDPEKAIEEVAEKIESAPVINLLGEGLTVEEILEQAKEDLIVKEDAELEPQPIIKLGSHLLLSKGNIGLVSGSEGVMKSTFARMVVAGAIKHEKAKTWDNFANIEVFADGTKAVLFFDSEQSKHRQGKNLKEILRRSKNEDIPPHYYSFDFVSKSPEEFLTRFNNYVKAIAKIHDGISIIVVDQLGDMLANINDIAEVKVLMNSLREVSRRYDCGILGIIHFNPQGTKERGHIGTELRQKAEINMFIKRDPNTGVSELHIRKAREANEWDIPIMMFAFDKQKMMVVDKGSKSRSNNEGSELKELVREAYMTREDMGLSNSDLFKFFTKKGIVKDKNQFNRMIKKMLDRYELMRKEGEGRNVKYFIHEDVLISEHKNKEIDWEEK